MHQIQSGAKEPVEALVLGIAGDRLTGLSNLYLQIRRTSDNAYFDWDDNLFKPLALQPLLQMIEIDPGSSPGEYALNLPAKGHDWGFNTAEIRNPVDGDVYRLILTQEGTPQSAANVPQLNHLKVGGFVDYIDEPVSDQASPAEVRTALRDYGLDHLITVNPGIVPPAAGTYIRQILDKEDLLLDRQQTYSVQQNWSYRSIDQKMFGHVWIEAQNLIVLTAINCTINWCRHPTGAVLFSESVAAPDSRGVFQFTFDAPGLTSNSAYYIEAAIEVPSYGPIKGIKGIFTLG